jgi:hypothetical protein
MSGRFLAEFAEQARDDLSEALDNVAQTISTKLIGKAADTEEANLDRTLATEAKNTERFTNTLDKLNTDTEDTYAASAEHRKITDALGPRKQTSGVPLPNDLEGLHSKPSKSGLVNDAFRPYNGPGGLIHDDPQWQNDIEGDFPKDANGEPLVHVDPRTAGWVARSNDGGSTVKGRANNCADCSRSVIASWLGQPTCAQRRLVNPRSGSDGERDPERNSIANIEAFAGAKFKPNGAGGSVGYQSVASRLQAAGPGSSAIVVVAWPKINPATGKVMLDPKTQLPLADGGHAFNAVNAKGDIVWVDGQLNIVSDSPIHVRPDPVGVWSIVLDAKGKPV